MPEFKDLVEAKLASAAGNPQKAGFLLHWFSVVEEALGHLATMGVQLEVVEASNTVFLQFPKMLYINGLAVVVENSDEEGKARAAGASSDPKGQATVEPVAPQVEPTVVVPVLAPAPVAAPVPSSSSAASAAEMAAAVGVPPPAA
jgi:hypothetical protein